MIEGAFETLEAFLFFARLGFVKKGMELVFLPPMGVGTMLKPFAALFVACDESPTLPVDTEFRPILEEVRLAAEVLEVMRIHALSFVMLVVVGTPLGLEVEDIEVEIG